MNDNQTTITIGNNSSGNTVAGRDIVKEKQEPVREKNSHDLDKKKKVLKKTQIL